MVCPGRSRYLKAHRGITLIELMISATILSLVLAAVLVLQLQGLRMYQDVATTDWATFKAATAVSRMEEDIQGCFRVVGRYNNRITISRPKAAWDATQSTFLPVQPLQAGDLVRYYLSDATGALGRSGSFLWCAIKPVGANDFVLQRPALAEGIRRLEFTYTMAPAPRQASVASLWLLVEAEAQHGAKTRQCIHTARIVLRNSRYGPITTETGAEP